MMRDCIISNARFLFLIIFTLFLLNPLLAEIKEQRTKFPAVEEDLKCLQIKISSIDESYKINPVLRERYYSFITTSSFTLRVLNNNSMFHPRNSSSMDNFIHKSRFFSYINNVLNKNRNLILNARKMVNLLNSDLKVSNNLQLINYCKKIAKLSSRLDSDLKIIIPRSLNKNLKKNESYYFKLAR